MVPIPHPRGGWRFLINARAEACLPACLRTIFVPLPSFVRLSLAAAPPRSSIIPFVRSFALNYNLTPFSSHLRTLPALSLSGPRLPFIVSARLLYRGIDIILFPPPPPLLPCLRPAFSFLPFRRIIYSLQISRTISLCSRTLIPLLSPFRVTHCINNRARNEPRSAGNLSRKTRSLLRNCRRIDERCGLTARFRLTSAFDGEFLKKNFFFKIDYANFKAIVPRGYL